MRIEDVKVFADDTVSRLPMMLRPITESELLTLVADLSEKVWWCEMHNANKCPRHPMENHCAMKPEGKVGCVFEERFLLPVGVLVDSPKEGR